MIEFRKHITRQMLKDEPDKLFVFGDNIARSGLGGQAKEMRGEPNARGICTKRSAYEYMTGDARDLFELADDLGDLALSVKVNPRTVVWPEDGIGTGLADLKTHWPEGLTLIEAFQLALSRV